jgi:hypothetical protein
MSRGRSSRHEPYKCILASTTHFFNKKTYKLATKIITAAGTHHNGWWWWWVMDEEADSCSS